MTRFWLPPSMRHDEAATRVRECRVCGCRWPWDQRDQFARHVVRCAEKNEELIEAHVAAGESSPITSIEDKEQFAWIRKRAAEGKKATKGGAAA